MPRLIHGHTVARKRTTTYNSWMGMVDRCTRPTHIYWSRYGGRGILVCDRWRDYRNFLADMGEKPAGMSLDRINNDGNYEPDNCRWATFLEQVRHRETRWLTAFGKTQSLPAWSREKGVALATLLQRIGAGWPAERAIMEKPRRGIPLARR